MVDSPVKVEKVDCGNGKRKMVIREREYDMLSWHGLKTISAVVISVVGVIVAVLTAYYTAEASQNKEITTHSQRLNDNDRRLEDTFKQFNDTLTEQRKVLDENTKALIRLDTRQEVMIEDVKQIKTKINQ